MASPSNLDPDDLSELRTVAAVFRNLDRVSAHAFASAMAHISEHGMALASVTPQEFADFAQSALGRLRAKMPGLRQRMRDHFGTVELLPIVDRLYGQIMCATTWGDLVNFFNRVTSTPVQDDRDQEALGEAMLVVEGLVAAVVGEIVAQQPVAGYWKSRADAMLLALAAPDMFNFCTAGRRLFATGVDAQHIESAFEAVCQVGSVHATASE